MWTPPVYDRTQADVFERRPKGFINASDLNRIEENIRYMAALLGVTVHVNTAWTRNGFPTHSEISRILSNIQTLRDAYYTRPNTPGTPAMPLNTWRKVNDAERILFDMHYLYFGNQEAKNYTGEAYAGDMIGVI